MTTGLFHGSNYISRFLNEEKGEDDESFNESIIYDEKKVQNIIFLIGIIAADRRNKKGPSLELHDHRIVSHHEI
jgi:hypothetical protein